MAATDAATALASPAETSIEPSTSSAPSKSQLKKLAKRQAEAEAAKLAAEASETKEEEKVVESTTAETTALPEPLLSLAAMNSGKPITSQIDKRMKVLGKKLQRITAYQDIQKDKLNPDQVKALDSLPTLKAVMTELEEVKKTVELSELEFSSHIRTSAQDTRKEFDAEMSSALLAASATHQSVLNITLTFFRMHSILFPPHHGGIYSADQGGEFAEYRKRWTAQEVAAVGMIGDQITQGNLQWVELIHKGSREAFWDNITYSRINQMIQTLLNPSLDFPLETSLTSFIPAPAADLTEISQEAPVVNGSIPAPTSDIPVNVALAQVSSSAPPPMLFGSIAAGPSEVPAPPTAAPEADLEFNDHETVEEAELHEEKNDAIVAANEEVLSEEPTEAAEAGPHPLTPVAEDATAPLSQGAIAVPLSSVPKIDWAADASEGGLPSLASFGMTGSFANPASVAKSPATPSVPAIPAAISSVAPKVQRGFGPAQNNGNNTNGSHHNNRNNRGPKTSVPPPLVPTSTEPEVDDDGFIMQKKTGWKAVKQAPVASHRGGGDRGKGGSSRGGGGLRGGRGGTEGGRGGRGGGKPTENRGGGGGGGSWRQGAPPAAATPASAKA